MVPPCDVEHFQVRYAGNHIRTSPACDYGLLHLGTDGVEKS